MRKRVFGKKLKRDANERKALLKGLMTDLVLKESIQTTEEKAKAIRSQIEKLVTKVKRGQSTTLLQPYLSLAAVEKVMNDLALRFKNRPGGYVRIVKLGSRFGDNAKMAIIEFVEKTSARVAKTAVEAQVRQVANPKVEKNTAKAKVAKPAAKKPVKKTVKKETK